MESLASLLARKRLHRVNVWLNWQTLGDDQVGFCYFLACPRSNLCSGGGFGGGGGGGLLLPCCIF